MVQMLETIRQRELFGRNPELPPLRCLRRLNTYNYQGRLETTIVDEYTSGSLSKSERFIYAYNDGGIRVEQEYREDTGQKGQKGSGTCLLPFAGFGVSCGHAKGAESWSGRALPNRPRTQAELDALARCIRRGAPFGRAEWVLRVARQWGLESTLRPRGRPRNQEKGS